MLSPRNRHLSAQSWALQLTAALALVCTAACRDLKADPGYCATCALDGAIPGLSEQAAPNLGVSAAGTTSASPPNQSNTSTAVAGTSVPPAIAGSSATGRPGAGTSVAVAGSSAAGRSGIAGTAQAGKSAATSGVGAGAGGAGRSGTVAGAAGDANPVERDAGVDAGSVMTLPCGRECSGDKPVCDDITHSCVQCTREEAQACSGDLSVCDPVTNNCVGCLNDDSCPAVTPACDTQKQRCVTCLRSRPNSCRREVPVCDEAMQQCVECMTGQTQACRDNRSLCDETSHACVECLNNNGCPMRDHPVCSQHQCMGCQSQSDCRERFQDAPVCDMSSHSCVRCVMDSDCGTANNMRCDVARHVCEPIPQPMPGTKQACERCENDNQCAGAENGRAACGQLGNFGMYCFASAPPACEKPLTAQPLNGKPGTFCMPVNYASCEAVNKAGDSCSQQQPQEQCGGGGVCMNNLCTFRCDREEQCPADLAKCNAGVSMQGLKYCSQK
jgi:hypothetical protein